MAEVKEIKKDDNFTHIAISGRLDISGVEDVEIKFTSLTASHMQSAIVDLSELSFIASLGMRMLLSSAKALKSKGGKLVLLNPQELVEEALATAGFTEILPVFKDEDEAVKFINEG